MSWFVDGSNVLGRSGVDRESAESKRALLRAVATFVQRRGTRAVVVFDGRRPEAFGTAIGPARAEFAYPMTADDRIANLVETRHGHATVVTSDGQLASRVARRRVTVVRAEAFREMLAAVADGEDGPRQEDWESYFADPNNRNI